MEDILSWLLKGSLNITSFLSSIGLPIDVLASMMSDVLCIRRVEVGLCCVLCVVYCGLS